MIVGANYTRGICEFTVWAPNHDNLTLVFPEKKKTLKMEKTEDGYWHLTLNGIEPGARYLYSLDGKTMPDPASHFQPEGVFGPSAVVDHESFVWEDDGWTGLPLEEMLLYELHVGAFSGEGIFSAAGKRAKELANVGINAVEIMPVSQFPGSRGWGYDAVFPYAVQNSYGGPDGLKKMVQEFHANGVAVVLDVVYNHLGPEGNFLKEFGPYFLSSEKTPWGSAINFDGSDNGGVRNFFLENAVYWLEKYHLDGLRLDAVYAIIDKSPKHILKELSETVNKLSKKTGRKLLLIAENDRVDAKILSARNKGGFGLDAVWHDNLHHSIHALLTGERNWYYADFGSMLNLVEALHTGFGECTVESMPKRKTVEEAAEIAQSKLIVFSQNHDQIGNRPSGERLTKLVGSEAAKLAAAIVILSPYTPLLFMGEEYGETAPFLFFTNYQDLALGRLVQIGRKKESVNNGWKESPKDAQKISTFEDSKIDWQRRYSGKGVKILTYYKALISIRKIVRGDCADRSVKVKFFVSEEKKLLTIQRQTSNFIVAIIANFGSCEAQYRFPCRGGKYVKMMDSADACWDGPGSILPAKTRFGDEHVICPLSLSVYISAEAKKVD
jgi:maltooligosyltrehalose trehalohydrolase